MAILSYENCYKQLIFFSDNFVFAEGNVPNLRTLHQQKLPKKGISLGIFDIYDQLL